MIGFLPIFIAVPRAYADLVDEAELEKDKGKDRKTKAKTAIAKPAPAKAESLPTSVPERPQELPPPSPKKTSAAKTSPKLTEDIHFTADNLIGQRSSGLMEIIDNVHIEQGDFKIDANKAQIFFKKEGAASDPSQIKMIIASGKVHLERKDEDGQNTVAEAEVAEYDAEKRVVTLKGDAKLVRGPDTLQGNLIVYDLETGWAKAERVRGFVKQEE